MFTLPRTLEILLFAFCNFAPYLILSYHVFRNYQRFNKWITITGCVFLLSIQFATRYYSAMIGINTNIVMSIIRLVIFIGGYAILFDRKFGKILFIELIYANLGNFILVAAVCIERNMFPGINHHLYCWHASVVMSILHLVITIPWALEVRKYFIPMLDNQLVKREWNYYWIVPFVFYIIWQYQINGGTRTGLENIQDPKNVVFLFIINIGALLIYYIMLKLDGQLAKNLEMEEQQHYRDLEYVEYQSLKERIEETRRMRHDLRHHIHTVNYYLAEKDYDKLQEYIDSFSESVPDGDRIRFCENRMINSILFYFASQAKENEIDFQVRVSISEEMRVKEHDIAVLLGNLLENAIEACVAQCNKERRIIVKGKGDAYSLIFTIDNTFENEIKKNKKGKLLTTKPNGNGIGVNSAQKIVERYNGFFSADAKEDMFCVSFMLNL